MCDGSFGMCDGVFHLGFSHSVVAFAVAGRAFVLRLALGGVCALFGLGARQWMTGSRGGLADGIEDGTRRAPQRLPLRVRFHGCHHTSCFRQRGWRDAKRGGAHCQ
jgi:hypothetical protein